MKKSILFIIVFIFVFMACFICLNEAYAIDGPRNGKLLVTLKDNLNDDNGPGTYVYPLGRKYRSSDGMFDIREIKIYEVGSYYRFDIEFRGKILRTWPGEPNYQYGWLLNVIEIYIDMDHKWGSGHKNALMGRNLIFNPECGWERVLYICPVNEETVRNAVREKTDDLEFVESLKDFVFPVNVDVYDYALAVTVKKSDIGGYSNKWGFQAFSTVLDSGSSYMTFFNKVMKMNPSDDEFGGASNYFGAPNVLDILTPPGTSQKEILSKYYAHPNPGMAKFAKVSCVYNDISLPENDNVPKITDAASDLKISGNEKLTKDSDKKYELALNEEIPKNVFDVKERVIENKGRDKNKSSISENSSNTGINKTIAAAKDKEQPAEQKNEISKYEKAYSANIDKYNVDDAVNLPGSDKKNTVNIAGSKQNKNKADNIKKDKDKVSLDKYDEFMAKLERQKLDVKVKDDENAFDGVEDFLKKDTKVERKKAVKVSNKPKEEGQFNAELYEIAKTTDDDYSDIKKVKKSSKPNKMNDLIKTKPDKNDINNESAEASSAGSTENTAKPAAGTEVKNASEQAEPEQEDKSIIGRLFKKSKPKNKRPQIIEAEVEKKPAVKETEINDVKTTEVKDNLKGKKAKTPADKKGIIIDETSDIKAAKALIEGNNSDNCKVCTNNMKTIKQAAGQYLEKNPEVLRISMNMLVSGGYLNGALKCPDGGRYLIEINGGKIEVTCINVNNTGHGKY